VIQLGERAYEWSVTTDFTQEVGDAALAAELLTSPVESFAVADDEPLLVIKGIGPDTVGRLALAGVAGLGDLATLDAAAIAALATATSLGQATVTKWAKAARSIQLSEEVKA
jgi:predicted flap endonuclease-1-like 5' DNA nuclease